MLSTGHSPLLAAYLHRTERQDSATCPHCNGNMCLFVCVSVYLDLNCCNGTEVTRGLPVSGIRLRLKGDMARWPDLYNQSLMPMEFPGKDWSRNMPSPTKNERQEVCKVLAAYRRVKLMRNRRTQWTSCTSLIDNNVTRLCSTPRFINNVMWLMSTDSFWMMSQQQQQQLILLQYYYY